MMYRRSKEWTRLIGHDRDDEDENHVDQRKEASVDGNKLNQIVVTINKIEK